MMCSVVSSNPVSLGLRASRLCSDTTLSEELESLKNTLLANGDRQLSSKGIDKQMSSLNEDLNENSEQKKIYMVQFHTFLE